jgi:hypothetical protein
MGWLQAAIALLALATVATLGACEGGGDTCGRGRCRPGLTCVSALGSGRKNQGWGDPQYPNVDGEWWCLRPCPADRSCGGECLEDPGDSGLIVCAGSEVNVVYRSEAKSCLCDPTTMSCATGQEVSGFDLIDRCSTAHTVLQTCVPHTDCSAGTLHAGDTLPAVRLFFAGNGSEFTYCPAQPDNKLATLLPLGQTIRIFADTDTCH